MVERRAERTHWRFRNTDRIEDVKDEIVSFFSKVTQNIRIIIFGLLWRSLHIVLRGWYLLLYVTHMLQSILVSSGLLQKYKAIDLTNLRYLAVVVQNEEAHDISRVVELLRWLSQIGVKHVCLYDMEGVLKKSKEVIVQEMHRDRSSELETGKKDLFLEQRVTLEFASFSDGKEGTAKAADFLCSEYLKTAIFDGHQPVFTESDMARALKAVGCEGTEANLLLVYGNVRCHLGFPAWRMPYTEIVHMGPLKSMKYGALVKAIAEFTNIRQNYGT